jgi:hypothetical protein
VRGCKQQSDGLKLALNSATAKPFPMQLQMYIVSILLTGTANTVLARSVNERSEMPMALDPLRRGGDACATLEPALGLEFAGVWTPERTYSVDGRDRDRDGLLRWDDDVVCSLPICEHEGHSEWEDIVVHGLRVRSALRHTAGSGTYHSNSLCYRGV